jgi:chemotaxis protein histidine kinase CheA
VLAQVQERLRPMLPMTPAQREEQERAAAEEQRERQRLAALRAEKQALRQESRRASAEARHAAARKRRQRQEEWAAEERRQAAEEAERLQAAAAAQSAERATARAAQQAATQAATQAAAEAQARAAAEAARTAQAAAAVAAEERARREAQEIAAAEERARRAARESARQEAERQRFEAQRERREAEERARIEADERAWAEAEHARRAAAELSRSEAAEAARRAAEARAAAGEPDPPTRELSLADEIFSVFGDEETVSCAGRGTSGERLRRPGGAGASRRGAGARGRRGRAPACRRPGDGMTHAWLLTGPPGSGRSTAARAFAASLQCEQGGCGSCPACRTALAGTSADVEVVATTQLSIGVDAARSLVARAARTPVGGRWHVVVVEDADRLTEQAANALLKAIEEPTPRTVWLLCAPSVEDVIPPSGRAAGTSRCAHRRPPPSPTC